MNEPHFSEVFSTLDDVEHAPSDMVERVWGEIGHLLDEPTDVPATVPLARPVDPSPEHRRPRHGRIWLAVAAVTLIVGLATVSLDRSRNDPTGPPVLDSQRTTVDAEPDSTPSATPTPSVPASPTLARACQSFRTTIGDSEPFDDPIEGAGPDVRLWIDALTQLIDEIDRGRLLESTHEQNLTLRLLRTSLRSVDLGLAEGETDDASTALANAARLRDDLREPGGPLSDCVD